jgi:formylmethanofuran dehydrogenase subunit B
MTPPTRIEHVTCLGCGCGCDDIAVSVEGERITEVTPGCPVGRAWFGDGVVPMDVLIDGRPAALDHAIDHAAELVVKARGRALVYLGSDLSSQSQGLAVGLADLLGAAVDSATSNVAAGGLLVSQRRGRAGATLGEVRNRADVLVFWGVDPVHRYPRFLPRFVDPPGTHVAAGRRGRTVIGVSVGKDKAPQAADITLELEPDEEVTALSLMRASLLGHSTSLRSSGLVQAVEATARLAEARYVALVHEAEPSDERRDHLRSEGLIALAQALNGPTRAANIILRAGGNRVGAESVLTCQTGYPFSVDYSSGYPRYLPGNRPRDRMAGGRFDLVLIAGSATLAEFPVPPAGEVATVLVGPRASGSDLAPRVAIDTGVAGIHEGGTAYRLDEVPLHLRPPLRTLRSSSEVLRALTAAVGSKLRPISI